MRVTDRAHAHEIGGGCRVVRGADTGRHERGTTVCERFHDDVAEVLRNGRQDEQRRADADGEQHVDQVFAATEDAADRTRHFRGPILVATRSLAARAGACRR